MGFLGSFAAMRANTCTMKPAGADWFPPRHWAADSHAFDRDKGGAVAGREKLG